MERIFNAIGLGLVALAFVASLGRVAYLNWNKAAEESTKYTHIRLAHWQLERGIRNAFDEAAREYEKLHPDVRISQIAIPDRVYTNWLTTQLLGGTAPDIVELGFGSSEDRLAKHFLSLTSLANRPNPYNKGTNLENIPLQNTFYDGMMGGFYPGLMEFYGITLTTNTIRMFVNLDLLKEITGSDSIPADYQELISVCEKTRRFAKKFSRPIIPIASSRYNAPYLMNRFFSSQTQKQTKKIGPPGDFPQNAARTVEAFVDNAWSLDSPDVRSGLELMRKIGREMQPGFMQGTRDDALFYFIQKRALMITTGSWDSSNISSLANFRYGIAPIPTPSKNDPEFGPYVLGTISEAATISGMGLGVTASSKHPETAKDFLLFLASKTGDQRFADTSKLLPAVMDTTPSQAAKPFQINEEGYPPGFNLVASSDWADTSRILNNSYFKLFSHGGNVQEFVDTIRPDFLTAYGTDLARMYSARKRASQRFDVKLAADIQLLSCPPPTNSPAERETKTREAKEKVDLVLSSLNGNDRSTYYLREVGEKLQNKLLSSPR